MRTAMNIYFIKKMRRVLCYGVNIMEIVLPQYYEV